VSTTVLVGDITGDDDFAFTTPHGKLELAPASQQNVSIAFTPKVVGARTASLLLSLNSCCGTHPLDLDGRGIDAVLSFAPNPVDFGYLMPGNQLTRSVIFTNEGCQSVHLWAIKPNLSEFHVDVAEL